MDLLTTAGENRDNRRNRLDEFKDRLTPNQFQFCSDIIDLLSNDINSQTFLQNCANLDIMWMPRKGGFAKILISILFDTDENDISFLGSGAVKSAYKIKLQSGQKIVVRIYDMVQIDTYINHMAERGLTEGNAFAIAERHDPAKSRLLLVKTESIGALPMDISQYTHNLAGMIDHVTSNPEISGDAKDHICRKLRGILRANKFAGLSSVETRDAGIAIVDGQYHILQFDLSHIVAEGINKRMNSQEFESYIQRLLDSSATSSIEHALGESGYQFSIPY